MGRSTERERGHARTRILLAIVGTALVVGATLALWSGARKSRDADGAAGDDAVPLADHLRCPGCNVLIITLDTVRADRLPCHGYERDTTPAICALAAGGTLFENAYSPAPSTVPALLSIHGGRLVAGGTPEAWLATYSDTPFLAEMIGGRGGRTAAITDHQGLGNDVVRRHSTASLRRGFASFVNLGTGKDGFNSAAVADEMIRWLEGNRDRQFLYWAHLFDPHFNWAPPADEAQRFGFPEGGCGRITSGMQIRDIHALTEINDAPEPLTAAEGRCIESLHLAELAMTDRHLGRVLDSLERLGLADGTLVIISADHGEEFLERGWVGHGRTVYDELVHVPFVVRNPRHRGAGRVAEPVSTMLIRTMALAAFGITEPAPAEVVTRTFHYRRGDHGGIDLGLQLKDSYALVAGRLKLVFDEDAPQGAHRLYDLEADPGELRPQPPGARGDRLVRRFDRWRAAAGVEGQRATEAALEEFKETRARLRALGYVE